MRRRKPFLSAILFLPTFWPIRRQCFLRSGNSSRAHCRACPPESPWSPGWSHWWAHTCRQGRWTGSPRRRAGTRISAPYGLWTPPAYPPRTIHPYPEWRWCPAVPCSAAGSPARLWPSCNAPLPRFWDPEYGMRTPADPPPDRCPAPRLLWTAPWWRPDGRKWWPEQDLYSRPQARRQPERKWWNRSWWKWFSPEGRPSPSAG